MTCQLRHTALVVRNLEKSVEFYTELFGFSVVSRGIEKGDYIDRLTGIENAVLDIAKLSTGSAVILELIEYKLPELTGSLSVYPANRHGSSHIAITVEDAERIYSKLAGENTECISEPLLSPDGKVKVFYARDIDGIVIEIVEELI